MFQRRCNQRPVSRDVLNTRSKIDIHFYAYMQSRSPPSAHSNLERSLSFKLYGIDSLFLVVVQAPTSADCKRWMASIVQMDA